MIRVAIQAAKAELAFIVRIGAGHGGAAKLEFDQNTAWEIASRHPQLTNDVAHAALGYQKSGEENESGKK